MSNQEEMFPAKRKRYSWEPGPYQCRTGRKYIRLCRDIINNAKGAKLRKEKEDG